jgi:hypothetical protein
MSYNPREQSIYSNSSNGGRYTITSIRKIAENSSEVRREFSSTARSNV